MSVCIILISPKTPKDVLCYKYLDIMGGDWTSGNCGEIKTNGVCKVLGVL